MESQTGDAVPGVTGLTGFFKRLAQYYSEFLSTDFKRQRLPRRRLETSDAKGRLVGIPLQKYPGFQQKLWEQLGSPIANGLEFLVSRGSWHSVLPKAIAGAIEAHIAQVSEVDVDAVVKEVIAATSGLAGQKKKDPEIAFEHFCELVRSALARQIIGPLLDRMEEFFTRTEYKPVESLREFEDQLSARLTNGVEATSGTAFSALLVEGNQEPLTKVLKDQLAIDVVRSELRSFFSVFASGDLYVDLSDLTRSARLIENVEFYLHLGEVHHGGQVYPIFYMPLTAERTERGYAIKSDPHLYVNKRAMDYVAQEVARAEGRKAMPSVVLDRIFYLAPEQTALGTAQKLLDAMAGGFNLRAEIDLRQPRDQKVSSVLVTVTNRLSFSLFDRSDESMVNDYEALQTGIDAGDDVVGFFKNLIDDFLLNDPISVRSDVDREWEHMSLPQRLVFESPLPLVEEQRKILSAIKHPKSRFIAVEGPPGTGKSHTITAIAFNTILSGQSLLVLSDKKEALDVVESKLDQALARIRPSDDFPNPILRLGKGASNYARLMKKNAITQLQINQQKVRKRRPERERALETERKSLIAGLEKTAEAYSQIDLTEIASIEATYAEFADSKLNVRAILGDKQISDLIDDFGVVAEHVRSHEKLAAVLRWSGARPGRLNQLARLADLLKTIPVPVTHLDPVITFSVSKLRTLKAVIESTEDARVSVVGYLFAGKKLRAISRRLKEECGIDSEAPNLDLAKLRGLHDRLHYIEQYAASAGLHTEFDTAIVLVVAGLAGPDRPPLARANVLEAARRLDDAVSKSHPLFASARDHFYSALLDGPAGPLGLVDRLAALRRREARISECFAKVPEMDYLKAKTNIESLNTEMLAEQIDDRFIDFYDTKRNTATALGKIIREKQRFPADKFSDLKQAFPCVIASLRDYADFIPLQRDIFDLVIIDEASQVSIAQALPAIIRAKKVLVLGDRNQFGNVKTSTASLEVNAAYMQDLRKAFVEEFPNADVTARIKLDLFDIRSSVLDFLEPISNFLIQLRKHFRSYPEMISFSSKHYYGDSLQVMKIRGKSIDDVIEFDPIDHDGYLDKRNANEPEARRIIDRIEKLLDLNPAPTVGVITPHTEQQALIAKLAQDHSRFDEMDNKLRLKVMTFDTCQGEEREIIFYSLVATKDKDRLAYIFPRVLDKNQVDEVDHSLRLQRLNVGLSRGQEKIVFVHSKELDQYSSALKTALFHYRNEVDRAKLLPTPDDVDQSSPMERKVVHWLSQVPLIRELGSACEVHAQFELGKYLKQLDPSYHHPEYRVDFLIKVSKGDQQQKLVLEYDGFEFHFSKDVPAGLINETTWQAYLTPDDLEREKVLESFGVKMIRLNRFNLGPDPIATIDGLLRKRLNGEAKRPHNMP
jgi:hypothetical protein